MSNYSTTALGTISEVFKALSSTTRLKIFLRLARSCNSATVCQDTEPRNCCVGDLGEELKVSASTLSHHLKELKRSGLVQMERQGQQVLCTVDQNTASVVHAFLDAFQENAASSEVYKV